MHVVIDRYLQQDIFKVDESSAKPTVTCPAINCWQTFPNVIDMIYHLGEKCDLSKVAEPGRESFQHQYCLSNIARHFSCECAVRQLGSSSMEMSCLFAEISKNAVALDVVCR